MPDVPNQPTPPQPVPPQNPKSNQNPQGPAGKPQTPPPASQPSKTDKSGPSLPPNFNEADIHVMPEKFIGAPSGAAPKPAPVPAPAPRPAPVPPKPAASSAPAGVPAVRNVPAPRGKDSKVIIIAIAGVLVLGAGAVALIVFGPFGKKTPTPVPVVNRPANTNKNLNQNTNNSNANSNTNVNGNGNANANANANSNQNTNNANANTNTNAGLPLRSGPDSDSDGLTDAEEKGIYHTDPYNSDTDHDSYNDGNEVAHLYDPTVKAPASLKNNPALVKAEKSAAQNYQVLMPATWTEKGLNSTEFFMTAASGEFFEVLVADKPSGQGLVDWYLAMSPGTQASDLEQFTTAAGYAALRSPDRLTTYIDGGNGKVYTVVYNTDDRNEIDFRATYDMVIASFELTK